MQIERGKCEHGSVELLKLLNVNYLVLDTENPNQ